MSAVRPGRADSDIMQGRRALASAPLEALATHRCGTLPGAENGNMPSAAPRDLRSLPKAPPASPLVHVHASGLPEQAAGSGWPGRAATRRLDIRDVLAGHAVGRP